jgi:hypothetical protein
MSRKSIGLLEKGGSGVAGRGQGNWKNGKHRCRTNRCFLMGISFAGLKAFLLKFFVMDLSITKKIKAYLWKLHYNINTRNP